MTNNLLVWGGGAQSRLLLEVTQESPNLIFDEFLEEAKFKSSSPFLNDKEQLKKLLPSFSKFIIGIGNAHGKARHQIYHFLKSQSLQAVNIIHPATKIEPSVILGDHHQILIGAIINHFVEIGEACIVNSGACIDHESTLGNGVHIMGGVAVAGQVKIHDFATIGTNATILPGITIGEGSFVGAGAVVTKDIKPYSIVVGSPARFLRENKLVDSFVVSDCKT